MVAIAEEPMPRSTWREKYWPIEDYELKKVVPMISMMFLICFVYTLLRDLKDILVLTGSHQMPAASITYLKLGAVLPVSVIIMLIYTRMTMSMSKSRIFTIWLSLFVGFFAVFGFFLYPMISNVCGGKEWITNFSGPDWLEAVVSIFAYWPISLFYVMSEMWGTVVLSLLFWGFANDICRTSEAKRFYNLFNIGANLSLFVVGIMYIIMGTIEKQNYYASGGMTKSKGSSDMRIYILMSVVVICGCSIIGIYHWMQWNVLTDPRLYNQNEVRISKQKPKMSMKESLKMMFTSPYIAFIGLMVVFYGLSINLAEIFYKSSWKTMFGKVDNGAVLQFQGSFTLCTGFVTLIMLVFFAGRSVRILGWTWTALVTPSVVTTTAIPFMVLMSISLMNSVSISLILVVVCGFITVVLSKSCKYAFFDPTKEMAFIPLGSEMRSRAKAAVDVTGARFGKSGGSLFQMLVLFLYNTSQINEIIIPAATFLIVSIMIWFWGTVNLGHRYAALDLKHQDELAQADQQKKEETLELGNTAGEKNGAEQRRIQKEHN